MLNVSPTASSAWARPHTGRRSGPACASATQHRELADRPDFLERRTGRLVGEIDDVRLEGRVVFVEGHEDLLAKGRKRMKIEFERHAQDSLSSSAKRHAFVEHTASAVERHVL
jgi:hypothetical protein